MNISPLHLERYIFDHVHIEALPEREKGAGLEIKAETEGAEHDNDVRRAQLKMRVTFGPNADGKLGYKGVIQVLGSFRLDQSCAPEKLLVLIATEGEALLFGAVRELVCNLTARGPWPMLRLPNASFTDLPKVKTRPRASETRSSKVRVDKPKAL